MSSEWRVVRKVSSGLMYGKEGVNREAYGQKGVKRVAYGKKVSSG